MSSIVYGHILCSDSSTASVDHNLQVLGSLPGVGTYLIRNMFSLLPQSGGHSYYGALIHFAAYYKEFWVLDDEWIAEYEALLERLSWSSSEVIHAYTGKRYVWSSREIQGSPSIRGTPIAGRSEFASYHDLPHQSP